MPKTVISFRVNGRPYSVQTLPLARLLDVLRDDLALCGTKEGCGEGECGACAVLIDGQLVNSCLTPVLQAEGTDIETIESVALKDGQLAPLQKAFLACGGAQCGICTPGMIMATIALLRHNPAPTDAEIRTALAGNLCRCTGYVRIFQSVVRACQPVESVG